MIPSYRPSLDVDAIMPAVEQVLTSGQIGSGAVSEKLEKAWMLLTHKTFGCAVSSGQQAVDAALTVVRFFAPLGADGQFVCVPGIAFPGDVSAIVRSGYTPLVFDVDDDMQPDVRQLEQLSTSEYADRIVAVLWVHIGGFMAAGTARAREICDDRHWLFIEDAAHVHGASTQYWQAGELGHISAFSFFGTKVVTTGEGGMVLTDLAQYNDRIRAWRQHGFLSAAAQEPVMYGSNARLSDVLAAIGLQQTAALPQNIAGRARVARLYDQEMSSANMPGWRRPSPVGCAPNWYKYPLICPDIVHRSTLAHALSAAGVGLPGRVYDLPVYDHSLWRSDCMLWRDGQVVDDLPESRRLCSTHLCLPIYPSLTDDAVGLVCETVHTVLRGGG